MYIKQIILIASLILSAGMLNAQDKIVENYQEPYRPQIHFSPKSKWMNDPNGMVYYKGVYHLFYQYYPKDIVWGPMHWGHAISKDLIHWKQLPIALYPDSLGYIFSGSAVIDENNTSGFGKNGKIPMVAIFTHHDPKREKEGRNDFQNESLAYSLDEGRTWTKYAGNPVLKNPGIRDFRDPKVMWYPDEKKWVMTLATLDHITFFSSPDLKTWTKESEFGKLLGAHGGVWECPDLFPLKYKNQTYWVLIVNLNPGGPNGGSGTQYFIGNFNGNTFMPLDNKIRWADYGPDEYAGVTWNNTGARKIFLGWMSNWQYAGQVPTKIWRNAMTLPRELSLQSEKGELILSSKPVKELAAIQLKQTPWKAIATIKEDSSYFSKTLPAQYILKLSHDDSDFSIIFSNNHGEKLTIGYEAIAKRYFINRSQSGKTQFNEMFPKVSYAPRLTDKETLNIELVVDASSVELFADNGLTVMTSVFFPKETFTRLQIGGEQRSLENKIHFIPLKSIWK